MLARTQANGRNACKWVNDRKLSVGIIWWFRLAAALWLICVINMASCTHSNRTSLGHWSRIPTNLIGNCYKIQIIVFVSCTFWIEVGLFLTGTQFIVSLIRLAACWTFHGIWIAAKLSNSQRLLRFDVIQSMKAHFVVNKKSQHIRHKIFTHTHCVSGGGIS